MYKKKKKDKQEPFYLEFEEGKKLKIISIENYFTPEKKYANDLIDEYINRCKDLPKA